MSTIILLKYNNYLNRRIKKYDTATEYTDELSVTVPNINFNPADFVRTSLIINWTSAWRPDYLVVLNENVSTDLPIANATINSRWFITDMDRTRGTQYNLSLKHDVIADDWSSLLNSEFMINRCNLENSNPLIYNREGFTYNQIKKDEYFAFDETKCPWIVGYLAKGTGPLSGQIAVGDNYDIDNSSVSSTNWQYYNLIGSAKKGPASIVETAIGIQFSYPGGYHGCMAVQGPNISTYRDESNHFSQVRATISYYDYEYNAVKNADRSDWINYSVANNYLATLQAPEITETEISNLTAFNGLKILFSDGIYEVSFTQGTLQTADDIEVNSDLGSYVMQCFHNNYDAGTDVNNYLEYKYSYYAYTLKLTKVAEAQTISWSIPTSVRSLSDAPYTMFCIPYPIGGQNFRVFVDSLEQYKDIIMKIVSDIIDKTTNNNLYDIQLLPYCPVHFNSAYWSGGTVNLTSQSGWVEDTDYTNIIDVGVGPIGKIFFASTSSFNFSITTLIKGVSPYSIDSIFKITNPKIQNETEFTRLCDSTYTSVFEFSPAKNKGISRLDIKCTYKPYNPFILLQPDFDGLYGASFGDSRGLVCAGDYSLPIVNDAFTQYELTNKTYQQAFNREITHLGREYDIQKLEAGIGMLAGTAQGTASGAMTGGIVKGPAGAVAGGILGGTLSALGGIADLTNMQKRYDENIAYRKDMFNFNLQNIKALPDTLYKTSSIVANSKYVPYFELYSSTDEEKAILADFLYYNGMSAGYIDSITPNGFVQASVIKYNGDLDAQEVNDLNQELNKGVFFE